MSNASTDYIAPTSKTLPIVAWASCLLGAAPIGVGIAYIDRNQTSELLDTHYRYLIRTFWIGALFMIISLLLSVVLVGWFTMLATSIWYLIRCVKGLVLLLRDEPIPNAGTWLI